MLLVSGADGVRAAVVCWLRSTGVPLVPLWRSPLSDPEDSGTSLGPHGRGWGAHAQPA